MRLCKRCHQCTDRRRWRDVKVELNEFGTYEDKKYIYDGKGFRLKKTGIEMIDNARRNPEVLAEIRKMVER